MRCVVTGGAGFIGHHLCRRLLADGHRVRAVDYTAPETLERRDVWHRCERLITDLRDPYKTATALAGAEWVFHLAANVGGVGYLHNHEWQPYLDNTRMSLNVLEVCQEADVERMFYASSSCAYPVEAQTDHPLELSEWMLEQGTQDLMYGREKLATLRLCQVTDVDARVGLINSGYGPGLGLTGERMKFPAAIARRALDCRRSGAPLTVWGDGTQERSYIYIDDLVDKIVTVMTEAYAGPVNLTTSERVTCAEAAQTTLDIVGADVPIVYVDGPTGPLIRHCTNGKWEKTYGPDRSRPFVEGQTELVRWMEKVLYECPPSPF